MIKKALIVDDDDDCRYLLSRFLRKEGYGVVCSDSAICCELHCDPEAMCSKEGPCAHFFLTDNQMPGINGLMLIGRQKRGGCKVPMEMKAVLSGELTPAEVAQAKELGCKVFHKPYDFNEISDWLVQQENSYI